jgi:hypothetical protein
MAKRRDGIFYTKVGLTTDGKNGSAVGGIGKVWNLNSFFGC